MFCYTIGYLIGPVKNSKMISLSRFRKRELFISQILLICFFFRTSRRHVRNLVFWMGYFRLWNLNSLSLFAHVNQYVTGELAQTQYDAFNNDFSRAVSWQSQIKPIGNYWHTAQVKIIKKLTAVNIKWIYSFCRWHISFEAGPRSWEVKRQQSN